MIEIEQRFIGEMSFDKFCEWLAKESILENLDDMTGFLGVYGNVKKARKIRHTRPDKSVRFVLEVFEVNDDGNERFVNLTLNRDFDGKEALEAYKMFKAMKS